MLDLVSTDNEVQSGPTSPFENEFLREINRACDRIRASVGLPPETSFKRYLLEPIDLRNMTSDQMVIYSLANLEFSDEVP